MLKYPNICGEYSGLSTEQATENLNLYGYNTDTRLEETGKGFNIGGVFTKPRFAFLLVAMIAYMLGGDIAGGIIMLILTCLFFCTEILKGIKSDRILHHLKLATRMKYRVIRDGEIAMISKEYLVPDDIVYLQSGENIPADCHLLEIDDLTVDESIFTGIKTPVIKQVGVDTKNEIKSTCVYKGTRIISGSLVAKVFGTGVDTKKYAITGEAPLEEIYYTEFERTINKFMPIFQIASVVVFAVAALILFFTSAFGSTEGDISTALMLAVSYALCFLPAETSSIVRIYYLSGALKLAERQCFVKDIRVIEKMNALTSICIDKSGTIAKDSLDVNDCYTKSEEFLNQVSVLACDTTPVSAIDRAITSHASFDGNTDIKDLLSNELLVSYPFTDESKIAGNLWSVSGTKLLCIKGSPENIFAVCDMSPEQLYAAQQKQLSYASSGNQVIAVAYAALDEEEQNPHSVYDVRYRFMGLISLTIQTRDTIPFAIRSCYKAGVKVIMTTGDSPDTAIAIGKKIGLHQGKVITGEQLKEAEKYGTAIDFTDVSIFARITPEQKVGIIKSLQDNGEIVAIAGDNSFDNEVFEQADVGITMTSHTSCAAYEASDLIMDNENFNALVDVLKDSRQIHRNIKRVVSLVISSLSAIIICVLFNVLSGNDIIFSPIFLGLYTAIIVPALMMSFISNKSDIKNDLQASYFIGHGEIRKTFFPAAILKGAVLGVVASLFYLFTTGEVISESRSIFLVILGSGLMTLTWCEMSSTKIISKLFPIKSRFSVIISLGLIVLILLTVYLPLINGWFGLKALELPIFIISVILGILSEIWIDIYKIIHNKNDQ